MITSKEYRLPPHVIPELQALVDIGNRRSSGDAFISGDYKRDLLDVHASRDSTIVIESGLFSPGSNLLFESRRKSARESAVGQKLEPRVASTKALRNISIGIITGMALELHNARANGKAYKIAFPKPHRDFSGKEEAAYTVIAEEKRKEKTLRKVSKNQKAQKLLRGSIWQEHFSFQKDLYRVVSSYDHLPEDHPLRAMKINFYRLIPDSMKVVSNLKNFEFLFINRGLNTFRNTMHTVASVIGKVAKKEGNPLTPESYVNIFENSLDIARTLSNMHVNLFVNVNRKLHKRFLSIFPRGYDPKYFTFVTTRNRETNVESTKLAFSKEGLDLISKEKALFYEEVDDDINLITTRCPARRDGSAKGDDIIANLHMNIVRRTKAKI